VGSQKISIGEDNINWLLENDNPGVRVRTLVGLCSYPEDHPFVKEARQRVVQQQKLAHDLSWMALKGQILVYHLTALAEMGLSCEDVPIEPVVDLLLSQPFDANCADLMTLRAMVMLGYTNDNRMIERLKKMEDALLPDGGWLCLHRVQKMERIPKSCIKVNMHGLLLAGELKKRGVEIPSTEQLVHYFLKRRLFYRMDQPTKLVLNQPGRRMTDVFFPNEYFHVGLPVLLDALAALGAGKAVELNEAWSLLEEKKDPQGKMPLEGTLPGNKAYLPKERVGKPSKWATLYAYLAWKNR
jgi:hypothetical protein